MERNYSRFVVNLWVFALLILVTGYTANLTSMLTVKKLQPDVTELDSLRRDGKSIGYPNGSFVHGLLKDMGFEDKQLVQLATKEDYAKALSNRVSAIVDEIPYIKVFLRKYCHKYTFEGPLFRNGGFGFVFPKDSPLLSDISKAILDFSAGKKIERKTMEDLENQWFGPDTCHDPLSDNVTSNILSLYDFRSIFFIIGMASALALSLFFASLIFKSIRDGNVTETLIGLISRGRTIKRGRYLKQESSRSCTSNDIELSVSVEEREPIHEGLLVVCSIKTNNKDRDGRVDVVEDGEIVLEEKYVNR